MKETDLELEREPVAYARPKWKRVIAGVLLCLMGAGSASVSVAALSNPDKAAVAPVLLGGNPGCELGTAGWTASGGTLTTTTTAANVGEGAAACSWDSSAAAQTLVTSATIPAGLYGRAGVASILLQCATVPCTHTITVDDGTNPLVSAVPITSTSTYSRTVLHFPVPSSGSIRVRLTSVASNEPALRIDGLVWGDATTLTVGTVNQASFVGSAYIAGTTNCSWSRTNTALGAFGNDTDCPGPTVEQNPGLGAIQTTDTDQPAFTVNSLPPGTYQVTMMGTISNASSSQGAVAINDGTNTSGHAASYNQTTFYAPWSVTGTFTYTSTGNRTFTLWGAAASSSLDIVNNTSPLKLYFTIYRFPGVAELAFRPELMALSWSGYHDSTCTWTMTTTSYSDFSNDGSCGFTELTNRNFGTVSSAGAKTPGITFTVPRVGRYYVCAGAKGSVGAASTDGALKLTDGTTDLAENILRWNATGRTYWSTPLCGIYNATTAGASVTLKIQGKSASSTIEVDGNAYSRAVDWTIFAIDQVVPAPVVLPAECSLLAYDSNGAGGTRTSVRRFVSVTKTGSCVTETQDATNGDSFTINETGLYAVTKTLRITSAQDASVSVNQTADFNVALGSVSDLTKHPIRITTPADHTGSTTALITLNAGDVLRSFHAGTDSASFASDVSNSLRITKVITPLGQPGGAYRTEAARISSAGVVSSQTSGWISSVTDNAGSGDWTINIVSGTFSATPYCTFNVEATNAAIDAAMTKISTTTAPSATAIRYTTTNTAGTLSDQAVSIVCYGAR